MTSTTASTISRPLNITVLGGTGFTGAAVVRAAVARGHHVTSISRTAPTPNLDGVEVVTGSALEKDTLVRAVADADVVISALSPRGDLSGHVVAVDTLLAELAAGTDTRVGVIGGFSALRAAEGAPRIAEGDDLPPEYADEARQMLAVLVALEATPAAVDWFYVSPPMGYGAYATTADRGTWAVGGDVASFDPERSALSAADFAGAVLAEIETPTHRRTVLSVTAG